MVAGILISFVALPLFCIAIERLWPSVPGQRILRGGVLADVLWYFTQTYVSRTIAPWIVYFALLPLLQAIGAEPETYYAGFGPLAALPLGVQVVFVFVAADFLSYWQHRIFHTRRAWPIHAVHHSSRELDWLSSTRFHPLNEIGAQLVYVTPLLAIGVSPLAFVMLAPFTASYAVVLHANVHWTFGPLRYVIASPVFHRWHHTAAAEARDRNFAGFLPVWDVLFGTFFMPEDRAPERFGVEDPVPEGYARQLAYPLLGRAGPRA